jgi:hypothetical protein
MGQLIKTLLDAFTQPGNFQMRWHAEDDEGQKIPSGHYIINIMVERQETGSVFEIHRLLLQICLLPEKPKANL